MLTLDQRNQQLIANLEYIRNELLHHQSQDDFAAIIGVSANTYNNYVKFKTKPETTIGVILEGLNTALNNPEYKKKYSEYCARFPNGITLHMLQETDLSQMTLPSEQDKFYDKFWGTYLCYYMSTNTQRDPQIHYGILQMRGGNGLKQTECACKGIFSISDFDYALELFNEIKKTEDFSGIPGAVAFTGNAYISPSVLWVDMYDDAHLEHVAMSFDFDAKVLTRHSKEEKDFIGARGLALSQSHGQGSQSVSFPIVIAKNQLHTSNLEIQHYLSFGYSKINETALLRSAKNIVKLNASIAENNLPLADNADLLVPLIQYEVKRLLNDHTFNSHYYRVEEQSEFYHNILKTKKDN